MRLLYLLLSPTFGMHQYTADLAQRAAAHHDVHLVTTARHPSDRYGPEITVHTPIATRSTFGPDAFDPVAFLRLHRMLTNLCPDLVHITGPHLWNPELLRVLRDAGIPTIHTLHDLDPHPGTAYGSLLYLWNQQVMRNADHLLVHSQQARERVIAQGVAPDCVTGTSLLHGFWGYRSSAEGCTLPNEGFALFFGRVERYKGLEVLLQSYVQVSELHSGLHGLQSESGDATTLPHLIIAGKGPLSQVWTDSLPSDVTVRNRHIDDDEAIDLFSRCAVVVLPYTQASQSALIAAAYAFRKPVIVTATGALPEYVVAGKTGWIVPPNDTTALITALAEAFADPNRLHAMGDQGRVWYDRERQVEGAALQEMYAHVLTASH